MYSLSIDYIFNRVYDVLLWIKYAWYFWVKGNSVDEYLASVDGESWDGLRDRGWLTTATSTDNSLNVLNNFGFNFGKDTDGDGIPDASDPKTFDAHNLTTAQIKELYGDDLSWTDHLRMFFGMSPRDFDGDGVPDSVEIAKGMDPNDPDSDHDGILDGDELFRGTNPLSSDSDQDGILDGRDAFPLDGSRSVAFGDVDTDHDGVGDVFEKILGTDINKVDTDGDGVLDGYDPYPLDHDNVSNVIGLVSSFTNDSTGNALSFSIQNDFLSFMVDIISIMSLFLLPVFIFIFYLWFMQIRNSVKHYEHMFHDAVGYKGVFDKKHKTLHASSHQNTHIDHKTHQTELNQNIVVPTPKVEEYKKHPRWAMVEDYMSGDHETLWRIGILEADNLLHDAMRAAGYVGQDLGEMLMNADFRSIDLAWDAHKIRNRIAHEGMSFTLTQREAKRAFAMYEAVLTELKVI